MVDGGVRGCNYSNDQDQRTEPYDQTSNRGLTTCVGGGWSWRSVNRTGDR